jgi:hypothetical protein
MPLPEAGMHLYDGANLLNGNKCTYFLPLGNGNM